MIRRLVVQVDVFALEVDEVAGYRILNEPELLHQVRKAQEAALESKNKD